MARESATAAQKGAEVGRNRPKELLIEKRGGPISRAALFLEAVLTDWQEEGLESEEFRAINRVVWDTASGMIKKRQGRKSRKKENIWPEMLRQVGQSIREVEKEGKIPRGSFRELISRVVTEISEEAAETAKPEEESIEINQSADFEKEEVVSGEEKEVENWLSEMRHWGEDVYGQKIFTGEGAVAKKIAKLEKNYDLIFRGQAESPLVNVGPMTRSIEEVIGDLQQKYFESSEEKKKEDLARQMLAVGEWYRKEMAKAGRWPQEEEVSKEKQEEAPLFKGKIKTDLEIVIPEEAIEKVSEVRDLPEESREDKEEQLPVKIEDIAAVNETLLELTNDPHLRTEFSRDRVRQMIQENIIGPKGKQAARVSMKDFCSLNDSLFALLDRPWEKGSEEVIFSDDELKEMALNVYYDRLNIIAPGDTEMLKGEILRMKDFYAGVLNDGEGNFDQDRVEAMMREKLMEADRVIGRSFGEVRIKSPQQEIFGICDQGLKEAGNFDGLMVGKTGEEKMVVGVFDSVGQESGYTPALYGVARLNGVMRDGGTVKDALMLTHQALREGIKTKRLKKTASTTAVAAEISVDGKIELAYSGDGGFMVADAKGNVVGGSEVETLSEIIKKMPNGPKKEQFEKIYQKVGDQLVNALGRQADPETEKIVGEVVKTWQGKVPEGGFWLAGSDGFWGYVREAAQEQRQSLAFMKKLGVMPEDIRQSGPVERGRWMVGRIVKLHQKAGRSSEEIVRSLRDWVIEAGRRGEANSDNVTIAMGTYK